MKVICINNSLAALTVGKKYYCSAIIQDSDGKMYLIRNDFGLELFYKTCYFITEEEYRDKKLGELGI